MTEPTIRPTAEVIAELTGATEEQLRPAAMEYYRQLENSAEAYTDWKQIGEWIKRSLIVRTARIVSPVVPPGSVIVPATRVLDDADVAALRHLVADHNLVQTVVRQALRDTTTADLARIARFLGAQP